MRAGLEVLLEDVNRLKGRRIGVCCNHTAVDSSLNHLLERLAEAGVPVRRIFGPEHGVFATAQDMVGVEEGPKGAGPEVVSLYGNTVDSLRPRPEHLADLDILLFDIQDIGSRYYTYQATLGYMMEEAARQGVEVWVLDRPNPIDGLTMEGNIVQRGYESFVSAYPLAVRHGMTMGEMGSFFHRILRIPCALRVIPCEGWHREDFFDETGLPWVYPSPNMPTLETAILYPGMCLLEGTNLSEGRGTTRPFHLFGAPWLSSDSFTRLCRQGALDAGLEGVAFRSATFEPRFQKYAGQICNGTEVTVTDRHRLDAYLLGLVVLEAALRAAPDHFRWRTETYEFVDTPIAIDLLTGSAEVRVGLESRIRPRDLCASWEKERGEWAELRAECLLY